MLSHQTAPEALFTTDYYFLDTQGNLIDVQPHNDIQSARNAAQALTTEHQTDITVTIHAFTEAYPTDENQRATSEVSYA